MKKGLWFYFGLFLPPTNKKGVISVRPYYFGIESLTDFPTTFTTISKQIISKYMNTSYLGVWLGEGGRDRDEAQVLGAEREWAEPARRSPATRALICPPPSGDIHVNDRSLHKLPLHNICTNICIFS